jgi:hypothetical protein
MVINMEKLLLTFGVRQVEEVISSRNKGMPVVA